MAYDVVDEDAVYLTTGQPLPRDIAHMVDSMLNDSFDSTFASMDEHAYPSASFPSLACSPC